jgi:hypothetical protein
VRGPRQDRARPGRSMGRSKGMHDRVSPQHRAQAALSTGRARPQAALSTSLEDLSTIT